MKAVLQRVTSARVTVDGRVVGEIGLGLLVLLGVEAGDTDREFEQMMGKMIGLRLFADANGNMNLSCEDVGGSYLVVSQFTLCADTKRGKRPGLEPAMKPEGARIVYERFCRELGLRSGRPVATGEFGAMMDVSLVNSGPVTILLQYSAEAST